MGLLYLFAPDAFLILHRLGADTREFLEVRDITVILLRFVAAYCLLDAVQVVFPSAIKGAGDTRFVPGYGVRFLQGKRREMRVIEVV